MAIDSLEYDDKVGTVYLKENADESGIYLEIEGQSDLGLMLGPETVENIHVILQEETYEKHELREEVLDEECAICRERVDQGIWVEPFRWSKFHKSCLRTGVDRCLELMDQNPEQIAALEL